MLLNIQVVYSYHSALEIHVGLYLITYCTTERNCGSDIQATDQLMTFNSPEYPLVYRPSLKCVWRIFPSANQSIQLTIGDFQTESCCDIVQVNSNDFLCRITLMKITLLIFLCLITVSSYVQQ